MIKEFITYVLVCDSCEAELQGAPAESLESLTKHAVGFRRWECLDEAEGSWCCFRVPCRQALGLPIKRVEGRLAGWEEVIISWPQRDGDPDKG